jgi:hypothetical protein
MTQEEKLIELVKSKLPQLLREDEEFRALVFGTLIQYLPTREETKLILERMEHHDAEMVELKQEQVGLRQEMVALRKEFGQRFERIEAELVELKREQVRLRQEMAALREEFSQRFERLEAELVALREDSNKRFEQVDKRFEQVDKRFEQVDKRFERIEAELVELRKEQIALREDFNRMQQTIEAFQRETRAEFRSLRSEIGEMRTGFSRLGVLVESLLRNALQTAVETWLQAGRVEHIELGGREVDVVVRDGEHVILEITARAHAKDIDKLKASARVYERQFGIKPRLAIACAYITPAIVRRLTEEGIDLISAEPPE